MPVTPENAFIAAMVAMATVLVRTVFDFVKWVMNREKEDFKNKKSDAELEVERQENQEYRLMVKQVDDVHEIVNVRDHAGRPLVWTADPLLSEKIRELRGALERLEHHVSDIERRLIDHDQWERREKMGNPLKE